MSVARASSRTCGLHHTRAALLLACVLVPSLARAQRLPRTDDISRAALVESPNAAIACSTNDASHGLTGLQNLGDQPLPISLEGSIALETRQKLPGSVTDEWRWDGIAQVRLHGRHTGCHFDWRVRSVVGFRGDVGGDATVVMRTAAFGGAVSAFGQFGAASRGVAVERLDIDRRAEIGAAYTTFNLYKAFLPFLYSRAVIDLRAQLSGGLSRGYVEVPGQSSSADWNASVAAKIEEFLHGGVLYTIRAVPDYASDLRLLEQSTGLILGVRDTGTGSNWLAKRSPHVLAQIDWRRLGSGPAQRALGAYIGFTLY